MDNQSVRHELDELEEHRFEPWFPDSLLQDLGQWADTDEPGLVDDLWDALSTLVRKRDDQAQRGEPHLDAQQRKRLVRIKRQLDDTLRACGPDVEETQRLIGNWAEGGLLNGLAMTQMVDVMAVLSMEIRERLSGNRPRAPKRPKRDAFREFCSDVVLALDSRGEEIRAGRRSETVQVLRLLLKAAEFPVPDKLHVYVSDAKEHMPAVLRERTHQRALAATLLDKSTTQPKTFPR